MHHDCSRMSLADDSERIFGSGQGSSSFITSAAGPRGFHAARVGQQQLAVGKSVLAGLSPLCVATLTQAYGDAVDGVFVDSIHEREILSTIASADDELLKLAHAVEKGYHGVVELAVDNPSRNRQISTREKLHGRDLGLSVVSRNLLCPVNLSGTTHWSNLISLKGESEFLCNCSKKKRCQAPRSVDLSPFDVAIWREPTQPQTIYGAE